MTSFQTISGLGAATALNGTEQVWLVQQGVDVRATLSQISAYAVTFPGATLTSPLTINWSTGTSLGGGTLQLNLQGPAGTVRGINFYTGTSLRWTVGPGGAAETGGNAGSNFNIARYDDTGAAIDTAIAFNRQTGLVTIGGNLSTGAMVQGPTTLKDLNTSNSVQVGAYTPVNTFNAISLNGVRDVTMMGLVGGASGNSTLFLYAPSGGAFDWRVGGIDTVILTATQLYPATDGAVGLGTSTAHWASLYVAGGSSATTNNITIDAAAGNPRRVQYTTSGSLRWDVRSDGASEGGGNSGSNFAIGSYTDGGAFLANPLTILRSTGVVTLSSGLVVTGNITNSTAVGNPTMGVSVTAGAGQALLEFLDTQASHIGGVFNTGSSSASLSCYTAGVFSSAIFTFTASSLTLNQPTTASSSLLSSSASGGVGYATGAGGTIAQTSSKSTSVTLNKTTGQITMNNAALGAGVKVSFTLSNSVIAATDGVIVWIASGGTASAYRAEVTAVASTSCAITVENITAGSLSESPVVGFAVIKAVTS